MLRGWYVQMVADRLSIKTLIAVVLAVSALAASPLQAAECIYAGLNGGAPEGQRGVAAIDADTLSVVGIIPTGGVGGATIAIDRARLRAYLSAGLGIVVADLRTNSVVDTIALPTGLRLAYQLLLSPDGLILYVLVGNTLLVVDTVSRVVSIAPVDLVANNGTPLMDITPDGKFLYVARQYHGLSVVDTTTFEIVANVSGFPPGAFAYSVVIAPDGRRAYTVDPGNMVSVIDTGTNAVVDRIQIRDCRRIHDVDQNCGTVSVAISPDGQRLYAVNSTDGSIEILDTTTFREVGIIREILDPELLMNDIVAVVHPVFAALSPDGQLLAATHSYFEDFNLLPQPNLIWVTRGFVPQRVWFSDSPVPVFSERALAIASVPSGCAGRSTCAGDCDGSRTVTVDELVRGVNMALGTASDPDCFSFDADADGRVTVDELLRAVDHALSGCPVPTPTPSPTPTGTSTPTNTPTITPTPTPTGCGALPPQVTAVSAGDCHDPTALLTGTAVALGPSMTVRVCGDLGCSTTDLPAAFPMTYPFSLRVGLVEDRINKLEACALNLACGDVACTHRDTNGNPLWVSGPTPFPCQLTPTPTPS